MINLYQCNDHEDWCTPYRFVECEYDEYDDQWYLVMEVE